MIWNKKIKNLGFSSVLKNIAENGHFFQFRGFWTATKSKFYPPPST